MSTIQNVAVFGAGGRLGKLVVEALRKSNFSVIAIARPESTSATSDDVKVIKTEMTIPSLTEALKGQDAVVSVVGVTSKTQQKIIIDAAVAAGVKRFIPSDFGNSPRFQGMFSVLKDIRLENKAVIDYAQEKADASQGFTWTAIAPGVFIDLALKLYGPIFGFNIPARKATIYDSGSEKFTGTTMPDIAQTVVGVLENLEATANQHISVRSTETSQNELLQELETQTKEKWAVQNMKTDDIIAKANALLAEGNRQGMGMLVGVQLFRDGRDDSIVVSKEEAANGVVGVSEKKASTIVGDVLASYI